MDIQHINQLISDLEIEDPAFEDTKFAISPLPHMNGAWLGAYFPDDNLIVLDPDASEAVVLHELGHRFYDYWADDLSEESAERFRRVYQGNYSPYEVSLPLCTFCGIIGTILGFRLASKIKLKTK